MGWPSCWYAEQLIFSGPHLLGVIVLLSVWPSCWYAEQRMFSGPHLLGSIVLLWDGPHVGMLRNLCFLALTYLVLLCCYIDELGPLVGMLRNVWPSLTCYYCAAMGWPSCWYAEQLIFSGPHLLGIIVLLYR